MIGTPIGTKLYMQVQFDLQRRIAAGEFKPGDLLPTEEQFCHEYGVSRITLRRAVDALVADLYVVRRQGVGTFVAESREALQSVRLRTYLEDILALDRHLRFVLLKLETIPMPPAVARKLRAQSDAQAHHECTIVLLNEQPFMVAEGYFPASLVPPIEPEDFASYEQPTERILGRAGIRIASGEQTITATSIPDGYAKHLKIAPATPVIKVERLYFDHRGNPVAFIPGFYHPERYQLTADIVPRGGAAPQIFSQTK